MQVQMCHNNSLLNQHIQVLYRSLNTAVQTQTHRCTETQRRSTSAFTWWYEWRRWLFPSKC